MREFRPPAKPSFVRTVLVVLVAVAALVPTVLIVRLATGLSQASYEIGDGSLVVRSGDVTWGDRAVRLADVTETRVVLLRGGQRTGGTALSGYCAGHFRYDEIGEVWQATTCARRALVVRTRDPNTPILVLTPPEPEAFQAALAQGRAMTVTLPPPDKGPLTLVALVSVPLALGAAAMLAALVLLGPRRMRYLVGDGFLEVRTLFGRKRIALAGRHARPHAPKRIWRVAGAAMPGYYTGLYRDEGRNVRVYATDLEHGVLVEGESRVIVSPEHVEFFLAALRDEGAVVDPPTPG